MFNKLSKITHLLALLFIPCLVFSASLNLKLEGLDGNQKSLSEYIGKGKWVVVNVWATACPYCRQELFDLTNFHDQHHKKDAMVIGLTLDWPSFDFPDKDYLADFALDYFIEYPLLMVNRELASSVIGKPVNMIPLTFFYNPEGELVLRLNGMVTTEQLEEAIKDDDTPYKVKWAEEVPPEFRPQ